MVAVAEHCHGDGQDADDERSGRNASQLHAKRHQNVIDKVAAAGLFDQRHAVGAGDLAGNAGKDRGCSNGRDGAVGEVAAEGEFPGGERGQRAGRNEDHAPHGPSQQGAQYANSHSNTREAGTV